MSDFTLLEECVYRVEVLHQLFEASVVRLGLVHLIFFEFLAVASGLAVCVTDRHLDLLYSLLAFPSYLIFNISNFLIHDFATQIDGHSILQIVNFGSLKLSSVLVIDRLLLACHLMCKCSTIFNLPSIVVLASL